MKSTETVIEGWDDIEGVPGGVSDGLVGVNQGTTSI